MEGGWRRKTLEEREKGGGWEGDEAESVSCETVMDNRMKSGCLWTAKQKWSPPPSHGESLIARSLFLSHLCHCLLVKSFANARPKGLAIWRALHQLPGIVLSRADQSFSICHRLYHLRTQKLWLYILSSVSHNREWFFSHFCEIWSLFISKKKSKKKKITYLEFQEYYKYRCRKKKWMVWFPPLCQLQFDCIFLFFLCLQTIYIYGGFYRLHDLLDLITGLGLCRSFVLLCSVQLGTVFCPFWSIWCLI